ncbi:D-alanyl-D-alanine carboxypeptidase, partial [Bacillus cereus]
MIINKNKKREFQVGVEDATDFFLIKGDTLQQVEEL